MTDSTGHRMNGRFSLASALGSGVASSAENAQAHSEGYRSRLHGEVKSTHRQACAFKTNSNSNMLSITDQHPARGDSLKQQAGLDKQEPQGHPGHTEEGEGSSLSAGGQQCGASACPAHHPHTLSLRDFLRATVTRPRSLKQTQDNGSRCCVHGTPNSGK